MSVATVPGVRARGDHLRQGYHFTLSLSAHVSPSSTTLALPPHSGHPRARGRIAVTVSQVWPQDWQRQRMGTGTGWTSARL